MRPESGNDFVGDFAIDVGEAEIASGVAIGEAFVVETEKVEHGCMEVVKVHFIPYGGDAVLVGFAVTEAAFNPAPSHPEGETSGVMVSPVGLPCVRGSSEFTAPDDEGIFEKATLVEVGEKGGERLVGSAAVGGEAGAETAVLVPIGVGEFDVADARFSETPGEEALATEVVGTSLADAVEIAEMLGFVGKVEQLGHGGLHAIGEFVGFDYPFESGVAGALSLEALVHRLDKVDLLALKLEGEAFVGEVAYGGLVDGGVKVADGGTLVNGGHEGTAVVLRTANAGGGLDGYEAGNVLVFRAESVTHPGSHAGAHELEAACMQLNEALGMDGDVGVHAVDETEAVGMPGEVRVKLGNGQAALTAGFEGEWAPQDGAVLEGVQAFPVVTVKSGLVVEGIDMGGTAPHAGEDNPLGLGGKMGTTGRSGVGGEGLLGGESGKGEITKPSGNGLECFTAGDGLRTRWVHGLYLLRLSFFAKWVVVFHSAETPFTQTMRS